MAKPLSHPETRPKNTSMGDFDRSTEVEKPFSLQSNFLVSWILLNVIGQLVLKFAFLESGLGNRLLIFDVYAEMGSLQWFIAQVGNGFISGIIIGLVIGGLQWFLLQKYFEWADKWLIISIIGWVLVDLWSRFSSIFMSATSDVFPMFISSIIAGIILGAIQWLVLHQHVPQGGWWIVTNGLAWFISPLLFFIVVQAGIVNTATPYEIVNRIDTIIRYIIRETLTAFCLVWLLKNSQKFESKKENL